MVFVNYAAMEMTAKIVYYGPGLSGKTTNLRWIHDQTAPAARGEIVRLESEADRTLFFDLLPSDLGTVGGMCVRLELFTVPGPIAYNETRRLVLKGVDGVVFVADSQWSAAELNEASLANLRQNLLELGLDPRAEGPRTTGAFQHRNSILNCGVRRSRRRRAARWLGRWPRRLIETSTTRSAAKPRTPPLWVSREAGGHGTSGSRSSPRAE